MGNGVDPTSGFWVDRWTERVPEWRSWAVRISGKLDDMEQGWKRRGFVKGAEASRNALDEIRRTRANVWAFLAMLQRISARLPLASSPVEQNLLAKLGGSLTLSFLEGVLDIPCNFDRFVFDLALLLRWKSTEPLDELSILPVDVTALDAAFLRLQEGGVWTQYQRTWAAPTQFRAQLPHLALQLALFGTTSYVMWSRRALLVETVLNGGIAARNLAVHWVWSPLVEMYRTVRYDAGVASVIQQNTLDADVEALVAMVSQFVQRHPGLVAPEDLPRLPAQVRQGLLDPVMKQYVQAMQHPLASAAFGPLVEMMLIQVHRIRTDFSRALFAMDRLLKSNELNFQMLAVSPLLALLLFGASRLRGWASSKPPFNVTRARVLALLLRVERSACLVMDVEPSVGLPSDASGLVWEGEVLAALEEVILLAPNLPSAVSEVLGESIADLTRVISRPTAFIATLHLLHRRLQFIDSFVTS